MWCADPRRSSLPITRGQGPTEVPYARLRARLRRPAR